MTLTKKAQGLIGAGLLVLGGVAGANIHRVTSNHVAHSQPQKEVIHITVIPIASPSATVTPTVFVTPTRPVYRYVYPTQPVASQPAR